VARHALRIKKVAAVDDDGTPECGFEPGRVEGSEFRPLGEDEESIGILCGGESIGGEGDLRAGWKDSPGVVHRGRVVEGEDGAFALQAEDDIDGGGVADVVGSGLEGQAEDGEAGAAEGGQDGAQSVQKTIAAPGVDALYFREEREAGTELLGGGAEGGDILGQAGASVADAGMEAVGADAGVETDALGNVVDVRTGGLADIGDGVDEGDFGGEEGIGCVLDDLSGARRGEEQRGRVGCMARAGDAVEREVVAAAEERLVDAAQEVGGAGRIGAEDDAVGVEEVGDGGSFAEEFRVGGDVEAVAGDAGGFDEAAEAGAAADGNGTFGCDEPVVRAKAKSAGDGGGGGVDVGEIGGPRGCLRRADGDEDGLGVENGCCQIAGEVEAASSGVILEEFGEVRLTEGQMAGADVVEAGCIVFDADDGVAEFRKAGGGGEADDAGADDSNGKRLDDDPPPAVAGNPGTFCRAGYSGGCITSGI
jgi:hypothetical protein